MPYIHTGKIRLYFEDEGKGEPLLMIQGLFNDHRPFHWLFHMLKRYFRVLALDNRGTGESEKPAGPYSIEQMADDVADFMDRMKLEKASVFGISFGGYISQMLALRHPQKVERLILGCTYFSGDPGKLKMSPETLETLTKREGMLEEMVRKGLLIAFSKAYPAQRGDIFEEMVYWRLENPVLSHVVKAQLDAALSFDIEHRLMNIAAPTLILHGSDDMVVPVERAYELRAAIKGSRLEILPRAGHLFFIEECEKTARHLISFIKEEKVLESSQKPHHSFHLFDTLTRRADLTPHKAALIDARSADAISYGQLNENATRAAEYFMSRGLRKGDRIGILSFNCPAVVEIFLACAKSGMIFVPFNFRLSPEELKVIIDDAQISLFFHDREHLDFTNLLKNHLPSPEKCILLDDGPEGSHSYQQILKESPDGIRGRASITTEDPLMICYTGGTTGRPKGAILTHGSILWNGFNTITGWGLSQNDITAVFTPLFHTGGLNVLLTPLLLMGGTSVIVPIFKPDEALEIIERFGVTYLFMVPSMYSMMIKSAKWNRDTLRSLREIVTGGAPCPSHIFQEFARLQKRFRMGYGLTEAGPNNFCIEPEIAARNPGAVGKPLPFIEVMIDSEGGDPGGRGELLIRGPHVFSGYWNKPEETARAFDGGWLRTGDLARRDGEGNYYIAGRKKEMFISGGENVFPLEIEEAILSHPDVEEVSVIGIADEQWGEVGLAAVVPEAGKTLKEDELKEFLREKIAHYKVPKKFIFMSELPRTGAGKVDRTKLKALSEVR